MKSLILTLVVSFFLVPLAIAQFDDCALCVPAEPLAVPGWTHPQPQANDWRQYVPQPNREAEQSYQRSRPAPRHQLNPNGRALTEAYSSGADYWFEDRTTRSLYSDPPRWDSEW